MNHASTSAENANIPPGYNDSPRINVPGNFNIAFMANFLAAAQGPCYVQGFRLKRRCFRFFKWLPLQLVLRQQLRQFFLFDRFFPPGRRNFYLQARTGQKKLRCIR